MLDGGWALSFSTSRIHYQAIQDISLCSSMSYKVTVMISVQGLFHYSSKTACFLALQITEFYTKGTELLLGEWLFN